MIKKKNEYRNCRVDADEKDMTDGIILDRSLLCPSFCDISSAQMK
jgi:hypothetical protein